VQVLISSLKQFLFPILIPKILTVFILLFLLKNNWKIEFENRLYLSVIISTIISTLIFLGLISVVSIQIPFLLLFFLIMIIFDAAFIYAVLAKKEIFSLKRTLILSLVMNIIGFAIALNYFFRSINY